MNCRSSGVAVFWRRRTVLRGALAGEVWVEGARWGVELGAVRCGASGGEVVTEDDLCFAATFSLSLL